MAIAAGARLGPYEIVAPLGAGGMGEVYRARDTRLDRTVAIKVLRAALVADPQLRERFEREARAVSSLQHPHICALFDVGRDGEHEFLVLEYLEGETLADRLTRGALPPAEALRLGIEICDALDRAHRAGIVHRDLKPANVMLAHTGRSAAPTAKLLDFGLAKSAAPAVTTSTLSMLPTAPPMTAQGTILGTLQYMAPEQLEGLEADGRTDIFAFGAVLFEMLTGRTAFVGTTRATLLGAIVKDEPPPVSSLQPAAPKALDRIIATCLAKDPVDRYQSARDLLRDLKWLAADRHERDSRDARSAAAKHGRTWIVVAVAAAAGMAGLFTGARMYEESASTSAPSTQFIITPPEPFGVPNASGTLQLPQMAVSPDGRFITFVGSHVSTSRLWLRPLGSVEATLLPGTEDASLPFWSPDSRSIGFFAGGKLKKVDVAGGPPVAICDVTQGRGGTWGGDNTIVFAHAGGGGLQRVSPAGGTSTPLTTVDAVYGEVNHRFPFFLPDGRHVLFTAITGAAESAPKPSLIKVASSAGGDIATLFSADSAVAYGSGHILFVRDNNLMALPFDATARRLIGDPVVIADRVPVEGSRYGPFSVSATGTLVYGHGAGGLAVDLGWFDRAGKALGSLGQPRILLSVALSPDGQKAAVTLATGSPPNRDVWTIDAAQGASTRLTYDAGDDSYPVWSPDGTRIAFRTIRGFESMIQVMPAAGGAAPTPLLKQPSRRGDVLLPTDWSPDGRHIAFTEYFSGLPRSSGDVWFLPLSADSRPFPLAQTPFAEDAAVFSPDGHWVAYQSDESGSLQVYVQSFPPGRGKYSVSSGGGASPLWSGDGREIFFVTPDGRVMSAAIDVTSGFVVRRIEPLFQTRSAAAAGRPLYSVMRDGKRFLVANPPGERESAVNVVLHWPSMLRH